MLIVLFFGTIGTVFGQMMSRTGVARNDVFSYRYTCYFLSNDSNAVSPTAFSWINQTDFYMINVTGISGSAMTFDTTLHMLNGTNIMGIGSMNFGSGISSMSGYNPIGMNSYYFMSSNVGMMGKMFPSALNSPTINDTFMMNYAGGQRLTNHYSIVFNQNGMMNQSDFYFDQATGAMVEWHQHNVQTSGNLQANSTQIMKLTSSSLWVVPEFSIFIIPPFLCIMISDALIIKMRKNQIKT